MPAIIRKEKIVLCNIANDKETITFTINIETNHINNQLDQILSLISNIAANITNYKKKEVDNKPKKKKDFGHSGGFV